jgi:hypothetical protein
MRPMTLPKDNVPARKTIIALLGNMLSLGIAVIAWRYCNQQDRGTIRAQTISELKSGVGNRGVNPNALMPHYFCCHSNACCWTAYSDDNQNPQALFGPLGGCSAGS